MQLAKASLLIPALLALSHAQAADRAASQQSACHFTAFVEETDPGGLNVRAAPAATAKVVGTLPPVWSDGTGLRVRVRVEVTASRDGWFQIHDAADEDTITGEAPRPTYGGVGWVSGRKLVVKSQANAGRTAPSADAPVAVSLKDDLAFDGGTAITAGRLVDCRGERVQVEYEETRFSSELRPFLQIAPAARAGLPKGRFRAWFDKICGIQETTCDGL